MLTTHNGLQVTHRTPTGTGAVPVACGNGPADGDPAAQAAARLIPVAGDGTVTGPGVGFGARSSARLSG
jgi:hypothetical protein